jgi:hypothetical protein
MMPRTARNDKRGCARASSSYQYYGKRSVNTAACTGGVGGGGWCDAGNGTLQRHSESYRRDGAGNAIVGGGWQSTVVRACVCTCQCTLCHLAPATHCHRRRWPWCSDCKPKQQTTRHSEFECESRSLSPPASSPSAAVVVVRVAHAVSCQSCLCSGQGTSTLVRRLYAWYSLFSLNALSRRFSSSINDVKMRNNVAQLSRDAQMTSTRNSATRCQRDAAESFVNLYYECQQHVDWPHMQVRPRAPGIILARKTTTTTAVNMPPEPATRGRATTWHSNQYA